MLYRWRPAARHLMEVRPVAAPTAGALSVSCARRGRASAGLGELTYRFTGEHVRMV